MNSDFYSQRFDSIQALRGLAAFSVILHHITWINNGSFGVDIFFCISGFIMMYVTEFNTDNFLIKRVIRIVPLYYCITLLTFISLYVMPGIFEKTTADPVYLIKALFFIPYSIDGTIQPLVRVGWTLNYEMFFYVILWLALKFSRKYRAVISSIVILGLVTAGKVLSINNVLFQFWTDSIIIEFIFGMLSYSILKNGAAMLAEGKKYLRIILLALACLCYAFMWYGSYIDCFSGVDRFIIRGIPAMIMFLAVFIAGYKVHIPKPFVFMGDISYSVYLIHYFMIRLYDHILSKDGKIDLVAVLGAVVAIAVVILMGAISYRLFEDKLNRFLRKKLKLNR